MLGLVLLAGCSGAGADDGDTPAPPVADASSGALDDGPPFDQAGVADSVDAGVHGRVEELTADREGRPVVLTFGEDGVLAVVRPTLPANGRDGWAKVPLPGVATFGAATSVTGTPSGTVLVTGYVGSRFAVLRVDESGQAVTSLVDAPLDPARVLDATPALSPDGTLLYVGYTDATRPGTGVLAVDPATGTVVAQATLATGGPGAGRVMGLTVSPASDRVFLTQQTGSAPAIPHAILTTFGMDLRVLSQVPLTDDVTASRPLQLAADEASTAYVTVVVNEATNAKVQLVAVPASATVATPVASFQQLDDVTALAVDGNGTWAYVGGLNNAADELAPSITPVDLRTGKTRFAVPICARGELTDIAAPASAGSLLVAGRCADTGFRPAVWSLH